MALYFSPRKTIDMSRPVRIEFPGAVYHITSRSNDGQLVFTCDADRKMFLSALGMVTARFGWLIHGYVLMDDHYHLAVETPEANLSKGMRQLNGVYTQYFNRTYRMIGPLFHGRFKGILLEKKTYLLEVCRHIVLNPVGTGKVKSADRYRWSSFRATVGHIKTPDWLHTDWILSQFGNFTSVNQKKFSHYVKQGVGDTSPLSSKSQQVLLGSPAFLKRMQPLLDNSLLAKKKPRRATRRRSLRRIFSNLDGQPRSFRNELICHAHIDFAYTLAEIGDHLGLHYTTVSKVVNSGKS